ncbi:MAG TPA: helix-turn-helix domain-containing protein, partial [Actinoplanes sp.]|nr:helix-turn-helix domain-containing protein [Actinoplanes sp.]
MDDDFASGVLVEAVRRVLTAGPVPAGDARVPLAAKRELLAGHRPLALMRAGAAVIREPAGPLLTALCAASGPADLFERWTRLERFAHSRHRVVVPQTGVDRLWADHRGPPGAPPQPGENALILGLLTGLLVETGALGLTVTAGGHPVYRDGVFQEPSGDLAHWFFTWSAWEKKPSGEPPSADAARRLLAADPARRWTLRDLAGAVGVPARTLQRRLHPDGFTGLLAAVRADAAATLLRAGPLPLGLIGFTCGYADQPHFTREFRRRTAMTP